MVKKGCYKPEYPLIWGKKIIERIKCIDSKYLQSLSIFKFTKLFQEMQERFISRTASSRMWLVCRLFQNLNYKVITPNATPARSSAAATAAVWLWWIFKLNCTFCSPWCGTKYISLWWCNSENKTNLLLLNLKLLAFIF